MIGRLALSCTWQLITDPRTWRSQVNDQLPCPRDISQPAGLSSRSTLLTGVTFGRLAVIDFELGVDVIVYLFTVLCDFARWSILDVVDSRMSANVGHMYN